MSRVPKTKKIADKLFLGILSLLVLSLGGLGSLLIQHHLRDLQETVQNRIPMTADLIGQGLPRHVDQLHVKAIRDVIEKAAFPELQVVEIYNDSGERVYIYEQEKKEEIQYDRIEERPLVWQEKLIGKTTLYYSVAAAMKLLRIKEFLNLVFLISAAGFILAIGLYYLTRKIILKPIEQTLEFSKALAEGSYQQRVAIHAEDEMGLLQTSLNQMAGALEKSVAKLKKAVQEAKKAHEEAEEAARLKGEFLANISHEIRTPLHAILGFADLLYEGEISPERRQNLETIQKNAKSLLESLNDILDFSKMESGKLILVQSHFNVRTLVKEMEHIIRIRLKDKKVVFETEIDEAIPKELKGDRTRLRQILLNLLINATKFTEKGKIALQIRQGKEPNEILFAVCDTGIGIAKEDHEKIFTPFTQADASFTKRYGGFGLGLSIVKRLVDLMGGKIWLDSSPGKGTTFFFVAPLDS